jgi:hypothetical protein
MKRPFFKFALATLTFCWLAGIANSTARAQSEGQFGTLVPNPPGATPPWAGEAGGVATFGTPPPLQNGRFSSASNGRFGTPVIPLEDTQVQVQNGVLRALLGEPQPGGVYEAYGTPSAYGPDNRNPYNGNPDNSNPYSGNPDSGNPDNSNPYGGNPDSGNLYSGNLFRGNRPATGYYGAGLESSSDNSGGGYLSNDGGFRGYSPYYGNNGGYGLNYGAVDLGSSGNHSAPAYDGGGYYSSGISGNGYSP